MTNLRSKTPSQRQLMVSETMKHIISELFIKGDVYHPILEKNIITISEVVISADLKLAKIFVYFALTEEEKTIALLMHLLGELSPKIRMLIARRMRLRYSPEIKFVLNTVQDNAAKLDSIFHKIKAN